MYRIEWCSAGLPSEPLSQAGRPWVFVDLETEGLDPDTDRVLEWAAVVVDETGTITAEDQWCRSAPSDAPDRIAEIAAHVDGGILVSHNIAFDLAFLRRWECSSATPLSRPTRWLCTWILSGHVSLTSWAGAFGVRPLAPHTARGDVITLARAFVETLNASRRLGGTRIVDLLLPWQRAETPAESGSSGWEAVLDSIDRVVPVHPVSPQQRRVFQSVVQENAVNGPTDPAAIASAIRRLVGAGVSRIHLERLLEEHTPLDER